MKTLNSDFSWPNNQLMAINLSYDDALASQLDNAIPALNAHNIKATFYLPINTDTIKNRLTDWQLANYQGHELGNHTIYHACSASKPDRDWVSPAQDLDKYTLLKITDEVIEANRILKTIDGKTERTFNPPCGDTSINGESYLPLIKQYFNAIRGDENLPNNFIRYVMPYDDNVQVNLISLVKDAEQAGIKFLNIVFHGIGGDFLSVSQTSHQQLLTYLSSNTDKYWLDTYINIIKYLDTHHSCLK